ncbi:MAG: hypothetical protein FWC68_05065, partial [Oscillospiraceae bacterium]|nr:hypothetical protein [Oscillospiraceae bacterium]
GMYVNAVDLNRQGWVVNVVDEKEGTGKIQVKVVREIGKNLDEDTFYTTDFEPGVDWCKALVDG